MREVWFFEDGAFSLHELGDDGYHPIDHSHLVPGLDFDAMTRFVQLEDQHQAVVAFRAWLREAE